jgi:peptidoglycan hydrolase-like protein with peptidoglycan-binding domain
MAVDYRLLLRNLESELIHESEGEYEFEDEAAPRVTSHVAAGSLRSLRFSDDSDLQAVAGGHVRLGRPNDSQSPAPILSHGRAVRKVQQALIDLGYSLPRYGDDSNYGQETYQAVLAYKRQFKIRTQGGYLDGIVGPQTITHLDSRFPKGPLPACPVSSGPVVSAEAEGEYEAANSGFGIPWQTCDPLLAPTPGGLCDKSLPDQGNLASEGGGGVVAPSLGQFYCINQPHIHLEFTATWEEMLPANQRPAEQRNRSANAPRFDVQLGGYREENLVPGRSYVRDITVTAPEIGNVHFVTSLQRNRIFRVRYSIQES